VKVAVVKGIYGGYDQLRPTGSDLEDVEWVCVTDDETLDGQGLWKIDVRPELEMHPRLAAKRPKCLPWEYVGEDRDTIVWMDGSCYFRDAGALGQLVDYASWYPPCTIFQFDHPYRDCLYDEATFSAPLPKYHGYPVMEQAAHYRSLGCPPRFGLWCTGLIVYRRGTDGEWRRDFGEAWLDHQLEWTIQDQVSEPFLAWHLGQRPVSLPGGLYVNRFVEWYPHIDGT
jgi:hypothetical protein